MSFRTKQREAMLMYLKERDGRHVTAKEIYLYFKEQDTPIGFATIYRYLDQLVKENRLHKYHIDGVSSACFQYVEEESVQLSCYHMKCEICGTLFHLECDYLDGIQSHVFQTHDFKLNPHTTVFYGTCQACEV